MDEKVKTGADAETVSVMNIKGGVVLLEDCHVLRCGYAPGVLPMAFDFNDGFLRAKGVHGGDGDSFEVNMLIDQNSIGVENQNLRIKGEIEWSEFVWLVNAVDAAIEAKKA